MENEDRAPKVLIADDEPAMQTLLADLLRHEGCEVVALAEDGEKAFSLYQKHAPEMVFLDINMPLLDGVETLRRIREQDKQVFVCMISGDAYPETVRNAVSLGVSGFIVKPISQKRIRDVIEGFHEQRSGQH